MERINASLPALPSMSDVRASLPEMQLPQGASAALAAVPSALQASLPSMSEEQKKKAAAVVGGATAALAALLLYRRLAGAGRLDIECYEDLEDWQRRALLTRLASAPPRVATVRLAGYGETIQEVRGIAVLGKFQQSCHLAG